MPFPKQSISFLHAAPVPTEAQVDSIAALSHPVVRNLQITQCYFELSAAFAKRAAGANWCTFATWASKQAGQTIRHEDLRRALEVHLLGAPEVTQALSWIAAVAKQLGATQTVEQIRQSALGSLVAATVERAGNAVSRGNKKVFEEIGREFARFLSHCFDDPAYDPEHIADFCRQLRPDYPPEGQAYLGQAFTHYYRSFFEKEEKKRAELQFLANLEIGFHEQTRLQPEIAESLNAAQIDPQRIKNRLLQILFPNTDYQSRFRLFFKRLFQQTALLDEAVEQLVLRAQYHLRQVLTDHLMTLTLPPANCLRLGHDLAADYPAHLLELVHPDLLQLITLVDPTPDSLRQSGAVDWADLPERMHYIADLFRCYHQATELFDPPFTPAQVAVFKAGSVPDGRL